MTAAGRHETSLDAYLKLLESKGADAENLARRRALLEKLLPLLANQPLNGEVYRDAVDACMQQIDKYDWPFFMTVVRDFYYFWMDDFKAIATLQKNGAFAIDPKLPKPPEGSLRELWARLDTEKLGVTEKWPINAYRAALRNAALDKQIVDIRTKMAKLLMIQLRQTHEHNGMIYRQAVESLLPVFVQKETTALFLGIVREFFPFWMGNPEAADSIFSNDGDHPLDTPW